MKIEGGCHCGQVRYEAEVDAGKVSICHCTDCQVTSGSAFRTIVPCPESEFTLVRGEMKSYVKVADSGNQRSLDFCPECGTQIYGTSVGDAPRVLGIRVGTVDQRAELPPQREIWCRSALGWLPEFAPGSRVSEMP